MNAPTWRTALPAPLLAAACALLGASTALAGDGQIDLLLDPAASTTLTAPGSYVLVAPVTMTNTAVAAIIVAAPNVTIDLNGMSVQGGLGSNAAHDGIRVDNPGLNRGTTVRNGMILNFGDAALDLGPLSLVEGVTVDGSNGPGLLADRLSTVRDSTFIGCAGLSGGSVVLMGDDALVEGVRVIDSSPEPGLPLTGIECGARSTVRDSQASNLFASGAVAGIRVAGQSDVADCSVVNLSSTNGNCGAIDSTTPSSSATGNNVSSVSAGGSFSNSAVGIAGFRKVRDNSIEGVSGPGASGIESGEVMATGNRVAGVSSTGVLGSVGIRCLEGSASANDIRGISASGGNAYGIRANLRLVATGNMIDGVEAGDSNARGMEGGPLLATGNFVQVVTSGGANNTATGIYGVALTDTSHKVEGNHIDRVVGNDGAEAVGIGTPSVRPTVVGNSVTGIASSAGAWGIRMRGGGGDFALIAGNHIALASTGTDIGIEVTGSQSVIRENSVTVADANSSIVVLGDSHFLSGNVLNTAITDSGFGTILNAAGPTPGRNVEY